MSTGEIGAPLSQLSLEYRPSRSHSTKSSQLAPVTRTRLRVTPVFDTYWRFAFERQEIYFRRLAGTTSPWTDDPILACYRFTNPYRAADRVSQFLIRHVIYDRNRPFRDTFFRVLLFKLFNRITTWESLVGEFGDISYSSFSLRHYCRHLEEQLENRKQIYSAAYIMPAADRRKGVRKHQSHLELLDRMMREDLPERIQDAPTMGDAFGTLREYPMMGNFLAYQFITDLNYAPDIDFSEMEFVMPGPGALDGIRKCFPDLGDWSEADVIRFVADTQESQFERLGIRFQTLFGRSLQLIDCQNLFCEVGKYARVRHPEIAGQSGRTRIKQKFRPDDTALTPFFPPKWGLNDRSCTAHSPIS